MMHNPRSLIVPNHTHRPFRTEERGDQTEPEDGGMTGLSELEIRKGRTDGFRKVRGREGERLKMGEGEADERK
jgi:hypothetical protein